MNALDEERSHVSVIIPCFNAKRTIERCLKGIMNQSYPYYEVIVIDDCSTDGTWEYLKALSGVTVLRTRKNSGPAHSRNIGIVHASGDILLLIDSDSIVNDSQLIEKHVLSHESPYTDVLGGGIEGVGKGPIAKADKYSHWFLNIPYSKNKVGTHLVTNNMSVKREVFEGIGGFREDLRTGEDTDFCERAIKGGFTLALKTDIVLQHQDRERLEDFLRCFYLVGLDRIPVRRLTRHRYWYLLPFGLVSGILYCLPLAFLLTTQIIMSWFYYDKKVLLYSPLIYIGRLAMSWGIASYFLKK